MDYFDTFAGVAALADQTFPYVVGCGNIFVGNTSCGIESAVGDMRVHDDREVTAQGLKEYLYGKLKLMGVHNIRRERSCKFGGPPMQGIGVEARNFLK